MLTNRKLLREEDLESNIAKYQQYADPKHNYLIPIPLQTQDETYYVHIFNHTVTTINKLQEIHDFLNKYNNEHKIVIIDQVNNKAYHQFMEFDNIEVFRKHELMINIINVDLQPKFEVLSEEEKQKYMNAYKIPTHNHSIMKSTDPVARHYNMKGGDIVKITSASNGLNVKYRFVKYDIMDINDWN